LNVVTFLQNVPRLREKSKLTEQIVH